jgi:5,10-methylenetetrahydromethanopterin reductase
MRIGGKRVPVYLAAQGPQTTRLAGEVADGILIAGSFVPEDWQHARGLIAEGAARAGRALSDVGVCLSLLTCIRPTREEALRLCGPLIVLRLEDTAWLQRVGIETHGVSVPEAFASLYPDPMHAEDQQLALDICATVPFELRSAIADKLGLIGSPADCIERLRALSRAGFEHVFMRTVDTLSFPEAEVDAYRDHIAAAVAEM